MASKRGALSALKLKKLKFYGFAALGLTGLAIFIFSPDGVWRTMLLKRKIEAKGAVVDSLAQMNRLMRGRIAALKAGEPAAIEEEARARGLHYKGEKIFIFEQTPSKSKQGTTKKNP